MYFFGALDTATTNKDNINSKPIMSFKYSSPSYSIFLSFNMTFGFGNSNSISCQTIAFETLSGCKRIQYNDSKN